MLHPSKNELAALFYKELTKHEEKNIINHVNECAECREYISTLKKVDKAMAILPEKYPSPHVFNNIMENISEAHLKPFQTGLTLSIKPVIQIGFSICAILTLIYFVQSKINLLPIWKYLEDWWLIEVFGSFGFVTLLFFCVGTFITLSLVPILYLDSQKSKYLHNVLY